MSAIGQTGQSEAIHLALYTTSASKPLRCTRSMTAIACTHASPRPVPIEDRAAMTYERRRLDHSGPLGARILARVIEAHWKRPGAVTSGSRWLALASRTPSARRRGQCGASAPAWWLACRRRAGTATGPVMAVRISKPLSGRNGGSRAKRGLQSSGSCKSSSTKAGEKSPPLRTRGCRGLRRVAIGLIDGLGLLGITPGQRRWLLHGEFGHILAPVGCAAITRVAV